MREILSNRDVNSIAKVTWKTNTRDVKRGCNVFGFVSFLIEMCRFYRKEI